MPNTESLLVTEQWPIPNASYENEKAEADMNLIMEAIRNLRNVRAEMEVAPSRKAKCMILAADPQVGETLINQAEYLVTLASCSEVILITDKNEVPEDAVSAVIHGAELYLPLDDLIDYEKEMDRLQKEKAKLEKEVERVLSKLNNAGFVSKAPANLLEEERQKAAKYQEMLTTVSARIQAIALKIS